MRFLVSWLSSARNAVEDATSFIKRTANGVAERIFDELDRTDSLTQGKSSVIYVAREPLPVWQDSWSMTGEQGAVN